MFQRHPPRNLWPILPLLLLAAGWGLPSPARATTFDFQKPPGASPSEYFVPGLVMTQDGIGLTANAPTKFLYQDQYGLGANNPFAVPPDDPAIDGSDLVQFQFTRQIMLDSITFTQIGQPPGGDWAMVLVGPSILSMNPLPNGNAAGTGTYTLDLTGVAQNLRVTSLVQVEGLGLFNLPSNFQIGSITVEQAPGAPLPDSAAAGLAMLASLVVLKMLVRPSHPI